MRDMHDGIGGELGLLCAALEQRKLDDHSLRDNLTAIHDELYLMVQSLDTFGDDPGIALGQIRPRLESRVTAAGMKFIFNIGRLRDGAEYIFHCGVECSSHHYMDQRATRLGGTLQTIVSECGTRIVLSLPWDVLSAAAYRRNSDTGNRSV